MHLTYALHRAVQRHPDSIAVRCAGGDRSYRDFANRVTRLAGALQRLGMQPGDRVAMLSLNSERYLEYQFAVPWGGGVLNPCNIRWSAAEIAYSLRDSGTTILLIDERYSGLAAQLRQAAPSLREVVYCGDAEVPVGMHGYEGLVAAAAPVPDMMRRGGDLAGIFYTGGTTGFPKGVMLSHDNIGSATIALIAEQLTPRDGIYLHAAPMFHCADFCVAAVHWMLGNTHAIIPAFDPLAFVEAVERDRVTATVLVPTMIQMLLDHPAMREDHDLSSLKGIIYGASPISEALLDRVIAAFPEVAFTHAYGMTELAPMGALNPPFYHGAEGRKLGKIRSVGRAGYGTEVRIVDADDQEVPRGTVGEIIVCGANVMLGYWQQPELTAAAIRDGWMHTGDGGYMDEDGFVFIVDRMKDMVVSGGENVYSAEVENAVARHPGVAAVAVIAIPSAEWGEAVHAIVVKRSSENPTETEIIAHCRTLIAAYKCPRSVSFVEAMPLSAAGKILKNELRDPFWQGRARNVA